MPRIPFILIMALPLLTAAVLPRTGPVPEAKPAADAGEEQERTPPGPATQAPLSDAEEIPTPEPKPKTEEPATPSRPSSGTETDAPVPDKDASSKGENKKQEETATEGNAEATQDEEKSEQPKEPPPPPPPPIAKEDPEAFKACLADLAALGTKYKTATRIDDGEGCGIDRPLEVAEVLPGIDTGGAQMRCETARGLGHWLKDTVNPALKIAMPDRKITGLTTGSTYACRLRNGASTGKISEHARGNAIDIAAFRLDDGSEITMKPRDEDGTMEGAFQRTATAGACLHFLTVLSPGSDAAHQDHLHLDVLERESGYRYCR